jgi:undecaprenyl-diphosphatase
MNVLTTLLALLISRSGDGWLYALIGLYLIIRSHSSLTTRPTVAILTMAVAVCSAMGFAFATKPMIARPRPEPSTRLLSVDEHSFPSGHTFVAAAFATSCGWFYPLAFPVLVLYAVLMGWSRVHLRVHYWSDVVAAGIWGMLVGCGAIVGVKWVVSWW